MDLDAILADLAEQARSAARADAALVTVTGEDGEPAASAASVSERYASWDDAVLASPDPSGRLEQPLLDREGRRLGRIELADPLDGRFDRAAEEALGRVARLGAAAVDRGRIDRELLRHADELGAVFSLAGAVASAGSLDEVFGAALDALERALGVTRGSVVLFDASDAIHFRAWRGISGAYRAHVEGSSPWKGRIADTEPLVVDDVLLDPEIAELHDAMRDEGIRSMLLVPLVHSGAILGRFVLYADRVAAFPREHVRLAVAIASHVAAAVERRRTEDAMRVSRHQLEAIVQSSSDGITVQNRVGAIVFANDVAAQLTGFDTAEDLIDAAPASIVERFELLDEDGATPLPWSELPGRLAAETGREVERTICYRIAATGERRWSLVRATPVVGDDGASDLVINVFHELTSRRRDEERLRVLADAGRALSSSADVDDTLLAIARLLVPAIADYCLVDLVDEDGSLRHIVHVHADPEGERTLDELRARWPVLGNPEHPVARVVATGKALFEAERSDAALDEIALDEEHRELYRRLAPTAFLAAPLVARGRPLGAVSLGTTRGSGRTLDADDLALAVELAERLALAVDNAVLLRTVRETLAQLETVLVSAPVGIGFWDTDLRFVRVNEALADVNRLPVAEHVGKTLRDVLPGLADTLEPLYRGVLETGRPLVHQESTTRDASAHGEDRHWLSSYFPVVTADGESLGVGAVILDVTERERAQSRLRFLARASEILAASLVVEEVVPAIAELAVEAFCESCAVWELQGDELVLLARADVPGRDPGALAHFDRLSMTTDARVPVVQVAADGTPRHLPAISDEDLRTIAADEEQFEQLVAHGNRSSMLLPLVVRGTVRGALGLGSRTPGRHDDGDFEVALELARRLAVELDQADLHREATESLALLDAIFSTAPAGLAFFDTDLRFVRINDALAEINGLPVADHVGRAVHEVLPDMDSRVPHDLALVLRSGKPVRAEATGETPAEPGVMRHWLVDYYPVSAPGGRVLGIGAVVLEITERKRAEARLSESEERFRTLANTIPALVWMCDAENRCTYFNRGWLEFTGRALEAELGDGWLENVHPDDRDALVRADAAAFERRLPMTLEYRLRRHDGVYRWILDEGVPRFDADGEFAGYIGACVDIDDRRRAEERERLLVDASTLLAASLDVDMTLQNVASLTVPRIADWCSIALRHDDGSIRTVAVAHKDPAKVAWAQELQQRYPTDPDAPQGAPAVIRSGEPQLVPDIPDELLVESLRDTPELLEPLRELGLRSSLIVPLVARDRVIGALSLITSSESGRVLGDEDLALAIEIAGRAAVAVENARLFSETELQRAVLERQGEASVDGLLLVSPDGVIISSNKRYSEIWELGEDVLAQGDDATLEAAVDKVADPDAFIARVRELYATRETSREELRFRDGRTIERYGAPVTASNGDYVGYLWSFRDVTERVRSEQRLAFLSRASVLLAESLDLDETLTRVAALAFPVLADFCVFDVLDAAGEIRQVAASHRAEGRTDFSAEMGRHVAPLDHPRHPVSTAIRTRETQLLTGIDDDVLGAIGVDASHSEFLRSLGVTSYLAVPLALGQQTIGAVTFAFSESGRVHTASDVSLAEELARRAAVAVENARLYAETEARAQAAQALEFVGDGVFLVGADGVIRLWNPAAERITGLASLDLVGFAAADVLATWPLREVGERQHTYPIEVDGRELWLALTAVPFVDGTVYAFRDLTEEQALERLKSDFVSTVSHELRTPLAAIYGAAMTLQRTDVALLDEQRHGLLGVVANESERLARIVNDVLWASRLDAGVLDVSIESCDAGALAGAVAAAARAHLPEGIELDLDVAPDLPAIAADPDKVRQVLVNLVDNAVKYSPDGGPVALRVERSDGLVRFSVVDRGLGIPPSEHERIFEKFFRLDPNLTRGVGGTGLGLYICRELVRRMNGDIRVESREGEGSTFSFELPVA